MLAFFDPVPATSLVCILESNTFQDPSDPVCNLNRWQKSKTQQENKEV
jgi:hypothetical protein